MITVKKRYLVIKMIEFKPLELKEKLYKRLINDFGEFLEGNTVYFEIVDTFPALKLFILKCNLEIYKNVCFSLATLNNARVVDVSGILRKVKRRILF